MKLALVDNNPDNLAKAKGSLGSTQPTEVYNVDVSKIDQWQDLRAKVKKSFGGVDFLMLNAGISVKGGWENIDYFHKVIACITQEEAKKHFK